jgi:hypothetical protein
MLTSVINLNLICAILVQYEEMNVNVHTFTEQVISWCHKRLITIVNKRDASCQHTLHSHTDESIFLFIVLVQLFNTMITRDILTIKVNKMHHFSTLFGKKLYVFQTDLLSIIRSRNTVFTAIGICLVMLTASEVRMEQFHPDLASRQTT